jgi:uncharacterized protein (TIGR03382 family)
MIRSCVLALSLTALCFSCAPQPPRAARLSRPMFGGSPDTSAAHLAVVAIEDNQGWFCSGTLITPTVVLTAAHCLEGEPLSQLKVFFGNDAYGSAGTRIGVAQMLAHPAYTGDADDIGLLRLKSAASATPIPALPASLQLTSADVGGDMDFSGFGLTETDTDGVKLHFVGPIGLVCPGPGRCTYSGNDVVPRAVAYAQNVGGPCSGDSGGPGFVTRAGQEYAASVTSYGDDACVEYGVSTLVSPYESFINGFIAAADGGVPGDGGQAQQDAAPGASDAATRHDGAAVGDGATAGDGGDGGDGGGSDSGCHCEAAGRSGGPGLALLVVALGVLAHRRRRLARG